jgi:Xaa-Pro aminopeptidase
MSVSRLAARGYTRLLQSLEHDHMPVDRIPTAEFAARRRKLLAALRGAVGLVFAGDHDAHLSGSFRPHPHFEYLTGVTDEPGAILLLDPSNPTESRRQILFLKPLNPELEKWDGYRAPINKLLKDRLGIATVMRSNDLPRWLHVAVRRSKKLACLHELAMHTAAISPDLEIFQKIAQRVPGVTINDQTELPAQMRAVKSKHELAMMQRAIDVTAKGFAAVVKAIRPGMNEFDVQEAIEHAYRTGGARQTAYGTIAGAGFNSTVLHYRANDQKLVAGELICIDSGAAYQGYSADITRTYPISGRFTKRQREVYEVVLAAELAAIKAVKPGRMLAQIDAVARAVINKAGFGDYFIHSIGHHLGLQTHDITPDAPLRAGAVITIEPGIYIPDEKIGIRIEDDVLVTKGGAKVLSSAIPKTVAAIEESMRASRE